LVLRYLTKHSVLAKYRNPRSFVLNPSDQPIQRELPYAWRRKTSAPNPVSTPAETPLLTRL
jgi:hypothetical protein